MVGKAYLPDLKDWKMLAVWQLWREDVVIFGERDLNLYTTYGPIAVYIYIYGVEPASLKRKQNNNLKYSMYGISKLIFLPTFGVVQGVNVDDTVIHKYTIHTERLGMTSYAKAKLTSCKACQNSRVINPYNARILGRNRLVEV